MTALLATCREVAAATDEAAIRATIDDFYLGWYDADGTRIARSLHGEAVKHGWLRTPDGGAFLDNDSSATITRLAAAGHGPRTGPDERAYRVRTVEVDGDIAAAAVQAVASVDFLHLVRTSAGWRIVHALWRGAAQDPRWRW